MFKDLLKGETHCDMDEELKQRALEMYKAPFRYEPDNRAIVDSAGFTFIESDWYLHEDGGIGELIAAALNEYWEKHK